MDDEQRDSQQEAWSSSTGAPQPPPTPEAPQDAAQPPAPSQGSGGPPPPPEGAQHAAAPQAPPYAGGPPPPPPRRRGTNWLLVGGVGCVVLILLGGVMLLFVGVMAMAGAGDGPFGGFGERVGVITVSGVISASGEETLFGATMGGARATMEQLRDAAEDDSIRAVVMRINSPGGSAAASQEIYEEVARLAATKPVVVSMADVAASGGYYIAAPADRIVASGSSVTGSIGVRMEYLELSELMARYGVEAGNLTTGRYKDTGSLYRPMRPDEKALIQDLLDDMYDQFVTAVAEGREMDEGEVRKLADGRIFTGEQALELGLIDEVGNFYRAVEIAGELGGIEGEPELRELGTSLGLWDLMGAMSELGRRSALDYLLHDERLESVDEVMRMPELAP